MGKQANAAIIYWFAEGNQGDAVHSDDNDIGARKFDDDTMKAAAGDRIALRRMDKAVIAFGIMATNELRFNYTIWLAIRGRHLAHIV